MQFPFAMNPMMTPTTTASHTRTPEPDFLSMEEPENSPANLASGSNTDAFDADVFNPGNISGTNYSEFSFETSNFFKICQNQHTHFTFQN